MKLNIQMQLELEDVIDEKKLVEINNKTMVEFLETFVGSQLAKEFNKVAYEGFLENESIEAITLVPVKYQVWEDDKNKKDKVLKDRYGFNLHCETSEVSGGGYIYSFIFDDNRKLKRALNLFNAHDMTISEGQKFHLDHFEVLQKASIDDLIKLTQEREYMEFIELSVSGYSFMLNNEGANFSTSTKQIKSNWSKKIKTSQQIKNIRDQLKREIEINKAQEKER